MTSENDTELVNKLKNLRNELFSKSEEDIFKAIHGLDTKYAGKYLYDQNINGEIINLATDKKSLPLIRHSIRRLKSLNKINPSDKFIFDIGNALLSMADIKLNNKSDISLLIENKIYRQVRIYFNQISDRTILPSAATNSGNILEKYGRYYEAILLYDKALKANPYFGMAFGNKGIALAYYFGLAIKKNPDILFTALDLLKNSLKEENTLEIGGQGAIDYFKHNLASLEEYLSNKRRVKISQKIEPTSYQTFCSTKNIYLNFCFKCYKCNSGFKDNFFPPFIENIKNTSVEESLKYHSFSKKMYYSIKTLNQILEDYTTSRSIYFKALTDYFNELDADTEYFSVLDYCKNSIKYGYLKTVYIKLFNILDKIARLTFYNYELELTDIYFKNLLNPDFKALIIKRNNRGLLALHNLAWDFEENGIYNHLRIIRKYLTHEFIDIKIDMFCDSNKQEELKENHHLTEILLNDYLDELFQIVKASLLYFGQALKKDHDEVTKNSPLFNFPILKQKEIFEDIE